MPGTTATPKYPELAIPTRALELTPEATVNLPDIVKAVVGPAVASEANVAETPLPVTTDQAFR